MRAQLLLAAAIAVALPSPGRARSPVDHGRLPFEKADSITCDGIWSSTSTSDLNKTGIVPPETLWEFLSFECTTTGTPPVALSVEARVDRLSGSAWQGFVEVADASLSHQWTEGTFGATYGLSNIPTAGNYQTWWHTVVFDIVATQTAGSYDFQITETVTVL